MSESLRERQSALTRQAILDALASLISGDGVHDFSVREVADHAGVSHRTVYRHFADREALLQALAEHLDDSMRERGGVPRPGDPDGLPAAIRTNYDLFEEFALAAEAGVVLAIGTRTRPPLSRRRSEWFAADLGDAVEHLPPPAADAALALLRTLGSSRLWFLLTRELGVASPRAAAAAAWAARTLLADLAAGGGPDSRDETTT